MTDYLKSIINAFQDLIFIFDQNGIIVDYLTPNHKNQLITPPEAFINKHYKDVLPPYVSGEITKAISKIDKGNESVQFDYSIELEGNTHWFSAVLSKIEYEKSARYLGVVRNITKRVRSEKALVETNEKLRKLNNQKDKLFSVIAHDLRNSITGSTGIFEFLSDGPDGFSKEELFDYLKHFEKSLSHSTILLENLLMWARNQFRNVSINLEIKNLRNIVDTIIDLVELQASEKQIKIHNEVPDHLSINADPDMLMTILRNLLTNAIKFSNSGGKVVISAEETELDVRIWVKDNGVGMNNETLEKIFDKEIHYTSKGTHNEKGSGLGLDLCIDFVEKHYGTITAKSTPGKGSTFVFNLPKKVVTKRV